MASTETKRDSSYYEFLLDAYYGTGGFEDGAYLIPHKRERDENLQIRKKIAYYTNYTAPVVDSHVGPIFRREQKREWGGGSTGTYWEEFMKDVDQKGAPLQSFMEDAATTAKVLGVCFIVVDNCQEVPATLAQAVEKRAFPYVYAVQPQEIKSWKLGAHSRIEEIVYESGTDTWTWTTSEWKVKGKDGERTGNHTLGCVPMIPLRSKRSIRRADFIGPSPLYPIARTNMRIYNLCSELDEILRNQAFAILTFPSTTVKDLTIGTNNALGYDGEKSSHAPAFIAPPADPAKLIMEQIDRLIAEIYRQGMLSHVTGVQKETSGVAKAWDFEQTNQAIAEFARACETAEKGVASLFAAWVGSDFDYQVSYPDDFNIRDTETELKEALLAVDLGLPPTFEAEVKKKVAAAMLRDIPPEDYDRVVGEIESTAEDERNSPAAGEAE